MNNTNQTDCPTCKVPANKPCRFLKKKIGTRPKSAREVRTTMHRSRIEKLTRLLGVLRRTGAVT